VKLSNKPVLETLADQKAQMMRLRNLLKVLLYLQKCSYDNNNAIDIFIKRHFSFVPLFFSNILLVINFLGCDIPEFPGILKTATERIIAQA